MVLRASGLQATSAEAKGKATRMATIKTSDAKKLSSAKKAKIRKKAGSL